MFMPSTRKLAPRHTDTDAASRSQGQAITTVRDGKVARHKTHGSNNRLPHLVDDHPAGARVVLCLQEERHLYFFMRDSGYAIFREEISASRGENTKSTDSRRK